MKLRQKELNGCRELVIRHNHFNVFITLSFMFMFISPFFHPTRDIFFSLLYNTNTFNNNIKPFE